MVVLSPRYASAEREQTFPVLTIGAQTYTNVTVTTKAKKYVMLMHSQGLANIKVSDLSAEMRQTLGYRNENEEKPKNKAAEATKWAKDKIASFKIGQVQAMEVTFKEKWDQRAPGEMPYVGKVTNQMKCAAGGVLLVSWLIGCACLRTICKKTGKEPGILIWLPILQIFPMLNAAGMSPVWILGVPLGLTQIVWCFQIAKARGKSFFTGLCLLLPFTNIFAFFYLTFSDGVKAESGFKPDNWQDGRVEIMTLETA
jgi:hypothetical protein